MGWETRRGKRVYVRKVREGGRVRSVYVGGGEAGERAAREDEELRAARRAARVAPAPVTGEEIIRRGCALWPPALRLRREEFLRRLLDRGLTCVACRSAGISDEEALKRGFPDKDHSGAGATTHP